MNFAEQLAYWYLRLNGFLPLTNFVLHYETDHATSDADAIAVRFPHVFEAVGGQNDDWDTRFTRWGLRLTEECVGLIVEVKSGQMGQGQLQQHLAGRHWRVRHAIKRLGIFRQPEADRIAKSLENERITRAGEFAFAKLLVSSNGPLDDSWLHLSLDDAVTFIRARMKKYSSRKCGDRMFFDGDLIQFLAWRGGRDL